MNADRSNFEYAIIDDEIREYGSCDIEIKDRKAEPKPKIRGDIARAYLYMNSTYPGFNIIPDNKKELFNKWNQDDPVSKWECNLVKKIKRFRGMKTTLFQIIALNEINNYFLKVSDSKGLSKQFESDAHQYVPHLRREALSVLDLTVVPASTKHIT